MEIPETQCFDRWRFQRLSVLIERHVRHSCRNAKCQLSHLLIRLSESEIQNWFTAGSSRNSHNAHVIHGVSMVTEVIDSCSQAGGVPQAMGDHCPTPTTEGGGRRSNILSADFHSQGHSCTERAVGPFHAEDPAAVHFLLEVVDVPVVARNSFPSYSEIQKTATIQHIFGTSTGSSISKVWCNTEDQPSRRLSDVRGSLRGIILIKR